MRCPPIRHLVVRVRVRHDMRARPEFGFGFGCSVRGSIGSIYRAHVVSCASCLIDNWPCHSLCHSDIKFQTRNRIQVRWKSRVSGRVGDRESKREFSRFGFPCCFRASSAVGFFTQCCLRFAPAAFNHTSLPLPPCILHYMQPRKKSCSRSVHEAASAFKRPYDILSF